MRSGPTRGPAPIEWQARHLLSNMSLPAIASGSSGIPVAGMLWCSIGRLSGVAPVASIRPIAPWVALAKWWSTMTYLPASGILNSTIAAQLEPRSTVCMPRNSLSGLPSIQTRSKIVPTTWKLDVLLGPTFRTYSRTRSPGLAGSGLSTRPL